MNTAPSPASLARVDALCHAVMVGVAESLRRSHRTVKSYEQACEVMRAEVKDFIFGPGYVNERAALLRHSIHDATVIASIVASCLSKIELL